METHKGTCCACHQEKDVFSLRKDVIKCADCWCNQAGRSAMDLFKKALKEIPPPVNVLVSVSGGSSSYFLWTLMKARLNTSLQGKSAVVRKLEAISTENLEIEGLHHIDHFSIPEVVQYAKQNSFNCLVLGDNIDQISLYMLAGISCGTPNVAHLISNDDFLSFSPVAILRPARQLLSTEVEFYCKHNSVPYNNQPTSFQKVFHYEKKMLQSIVDEGHGGTPFAIQKMAERLQLMKQESHCPSCGLPSDSPDIKCPICLYVEERSK